MLATLFTGLIIGVILSLVTHLYQKKSFLDQTRTKKYEDDIKKLKKIYLTLIKLSSERKWAAVRLLEQYRCLTGSKLDETNRLRADYRKTVKSWNIFLNEINAELAILGYQGLAFELENSIHKQFRNSHRFIVNAIADNCSNNFFEDATKNLDATIAAVRNISTIFLEEINKKWDSLLQEEMENLNGGNLEKASTWTLIVAIFHPCPNSLRVACSA